MSAQHTPGLWTQGKSEIGVKCVWLNGATEPKDEMGPSHTWIECGTKANASLIAAAPELLDQIRFAVALLKPMFGNTPQVERMEAAIAKAIG